MSPWRRALAEATDREEGSPASASDSARRSGDIDLARPTAAYLRSLVQTLLDNATTPNDIRQQCLALVRTINANDLKRIPIQLRILIETVRVHGGGVPKTV
jgi:hypothetical protein